MSFSNRSDLLDFAHNERLILDDARASDALMLASSPHTSLLAAAASVHTSPHLALRAGSTTNGNQSLDPQQQHPSFQSLTPMVTVATATPTSTTVLTTLAMVSPPVPMLPAPTPSVATRTSASELQPPASTILEPYLTSQENLSHLVVQPFVTKLFKIINDASHAQFVEWSTSGESFFITDVPAFENILPNHYKHRQFSSFVRQINMYGFTKINRGMKEDKRVFEFAHPAFLRGRIDLLPLIRRKNVDAKESAAATAAVAYAANREAAVDLGATPAPLGLASTVLTMPGAAGDSSHRLPLELRERDRPAFFLPKSADLPPWGSVSASASANGGGGAGGSGAGGGAGADLSLPLTINMTQTPSPPRGLGAACIRCASTDHHARASVDDMQRQMATMQSHLRSLAAQVTNERRARESHATTLRAVALWMSRMGVPLDAVPIPMPSAQGIGGGTPLDVFLPSSLQPQQHSHAQQSTPLEHHQQQQQQQHRYPMQPHARHPGPAHRSQQPLLQIQPQYYGHGESHVMSGSGVVLSRGSNLGAGHFRQDAGGTFDGMDEFDPYSRSLAAGSHGTGGGTRSGGHRHGSGYGYEGLNIPNTLAAAAAAAAAGTAPAPSGTSPSFMVPSEPRLGTHQGDPSSTSSLAPAAAAAALSGNHHYHHHHHHRSSGNPLSPQSHSAIDGSAMDPYDLPLADFLRHLPPAPSQSQSQQQQQQQQQHAQDSVGSLAFDLSGGGGGSLNPLDGLLAQHKRDEATRRH